MSLGTYNIKEEDARAYDAMAWRFVWPRLNIYGTKRGQPFFFLKLFYCVASH
jgi:hypothetical protein